jgi:L-lactate dehydrogenase complex protein LldF
MTLVPAPNTNTRKAADVTLGKREQVVARLPWERLRDQATAARRDTTEHLDELVEMFTKHAEAAGMKVVRAADNAAACRAVMEALDASPQVIIKSKSMVTEEIGLRHHMEASGFTVYETDLGEWIVQVRGELPSHVTAPAIHLSAAQIADTLSGVLGKKLSSDPAALTGEATEYLKQPLRRAQLGISGANFLIAETGEIVVIENEGNAYFCTSAEKHVVVTGIDKVIRQRDDLPALLRVLTVSATGQPQTVYTHVIGRRSGDGPARTIVLVDNGRTALARSAYAEASRCIRCGACMVVCPVFRQVTGHAYKTVYPGPIGILVAPYLEPEQTPKDAPFFSTLCGACSDICPVRIPISDLIAKRREQLWREGVTPPVVRRGVALWKRAQAGGPLGRLLRPLLTMLLRYPALRRLGQLSRRGDRR